MKYFICLTNANEFVSVMPAEASSCDDFGKRSWPQGARDRLLIVSLSISTLVIFEVFHYFLYFRHESKVSYCLNFATTSSAAILWLPKS